MEVHGIYGVSFFFFPSSSSSSSSSFSLIRFRGIDAGLVPRFAKERKVCRRWMRRYGRIEEEEEVDSKLSLSGLVAWN